MDKTISEQFEDIIQEMCDHYCRYAFEPVPDGKDEDWLIEDPESPCNNCPLNRL